MPSVSKTLSDFNLKSTYNGVRWLNVTVDKTFNIFDYYLKAIYENGKIVSCEEKTASTPDRIDIIKNGKLFDNIMMIPIKFLWLREKQLKII